MIVLKLMYCQMEQSPFWATLFPWTAIGFPTSVRKRFKIFLDTIYITQIVFGKCFCLKKIKWNKIRFSLKKKWNKIRFSLKKNEIKLDLV